MLACTTDVADRFLFAYAAMVNAHFAASDPTATVQLPQHWRAKDPSALSGSLQSWWEMANSTSPFTRAGIPVPDPSTCQKQRNTSDCGVFVIATVDAILKEMTVRHRACP